MKKTRISLPPEERKEEIIEAAKKLFFKKGYSKVTVNDIIKDLGIVKGTFYYHFKNKEEVRDIIVDRYVNNELTNLKTIINTQNKNFIDKLSDVIFEIVSLVNGETYIINEVYYKNPEIYQEILTHRMDKLDIIVKPLLDEGIKKGLFNPIDYDEANEFLLVNLAVTIPVIHYTINSWSQERAFLRVKTFIHNVELMLGAKRGSFDKINERYWHIVKDTPVETIKL
jgi:AcrR family transcriptional regulator